jgi:hypothetical protein
MPRIRRLFFILRANIALNLVIPYKPACL